VQLGAGRWRDRAGAAVVLTLRWDQRFESGSLQRRVCELSVPFRKPRHGYSAPTSTTKGSSRRRRFAVAQHVQQRDSGLETVEIRRVPGETMLNASVIPVIDLGPYLAGEPGALDRVAPRADRDRLLLDRQSRRPLGIVGCIIADGLWQDRLPRCISRAGSAIAWASWCRSTARNTPGLRIAARRAKPGARPFHRLTENGGIPKCPDIFVAAASGRSSRLP
jgi:hypothetical protein